MATVWALDLLALTGRRRNAILTLQWPMVDWQHSLLDLPDTKTGRLKVPLSARVLALLKHIHEQTGRCGGARTDLRRTVDAIRWILHTEAKWRELPAEYGAPTTCWRWYERWCGDGTWQQIAAALELPETEVGREPGHRPPRAKSRRTTPIDIEAIEATRLR